MGSICGVLVRADGVLLRGGPHCFWFPTRRRWFQESLSSFHVVDFIFDIHDHDHGHHLCFRLYRLTRCEDSASHEIWHSGITIGSSCHSRYGFRHDDHVFLGILVGAQSAFSFERPHYSTSSFLFGRRHGSDLAVQRASVEFSILRRLPKVFD